MGKKSSWSGADTMWWPAAAVVQDKRITRIEFENEVVLSPELTAKITSEVGDVVPDEENEVCLEFGFKFDYSGYYDPGVCSGPVERCYPPEGDDERLVTGVVITFTDQNRDDVDLSEKTSEELGNLEEVSKALYDQEIDKERDYDPPDYNDDYVDSRTLARWEHGV